MLRIGMWRNANVFEHLTVMCSGVAGGPKSGSFVRIPSMRRWYRQRHFQISKIRTQRSGGSVQLTAHYQDQGASSSHRLVIAGGRIISAKFLRGLLISTRQVRLTCRLARTLGQEHEDCKPLILRNYEFHQNN